MPEVKNEKDFVEKEGIKKNVKKILNLKNLNKFLFVFLAFGLIYYLTGVNDLTIKGFFMQELKNDVSRLDDENKITELKIMGLKSYNNLSQRAKDLKMVAVEDVNYITVTDDSVARK